MDKRADFASGTGKSIPSGREALTEEYYDRYASTQYAPVPLGAHDRVFERTLLPLLPRRKALSVLDVGCGQGDLVRFLQRSGFKCRGIDLSLEQVSAAHERGVDGVTHADLFEYLALHGDEFDVIIALDLIEHFDRNGVTAVLKTLRGGLRPGGTLVLRTPNGNSPFVGRYLYGDFTHQTILTPRSAHQVLTIAGFESVRASAVQPDPHGLISALRLLLWTGIAYCLKLAIAVETGAWESVVTQNMMLTALKPPAARAKK